MEGAEKLSLEQIRAFLETSQEVQFEGKTREENYGFVSRVLRQQSYEELKKESRGLVKRYLSKMTGKSRAQMTRLVGQYLGGEPVQVRRYRRQQFATRYTKADMDLLAQTDEAHETLSGPATQAILRREYSVFGKAQYKRIAGISVAHLYRLRKHATYRNRMATFQKTRPTQVAIGERRRPDPQGKPGYLRVDTVHQGDLEGVKGLFHINAVDEVTQWQVVGAVPYISEAWLMPVLQAMLNQFPFQIRGFHSDNGSEFINHTVSSLLNKLLIEQTKSRPRHSNDNGLVETKNGAVIRKHIGFGHIASTRAEDFDRFYREHFNPYLNFHRPCGVPELQTTAKGRTKRIYKRYETPWQILQSLPDAQQFLRTGESLERLSKLAAAMSDTDSARNMREAKRKLLAGPGRRTA